MNRFRNIRGDDAGFSLVEIIVSFALLGILIGIGGTVLHKSNVHQREATERTQVTTGIDNANGQLMRDVDDAASIRVADAQHLTVAVVRDGACNLRAYTADTTAKTLTVVTTYYEREAKGSCSGASESRTQDLVVRWTQASTFTYWGESETIPIPSPVQDLRNITRVQWNLAADPYTTRNAPDITIMSSETFDGVGETSGSGTPVLQAKRPLLTLTTGIPGKDAPTLSWTDPTPGVTRSWVVTRAREWEGDRAGTFLAIGWTGKTELTFPADTSLEEGRRASYIVYAILEDGSNGPSSNAVDTGLRPATVTNVRATGQPSKIVIEWGSAFGATAYDIYRDGKLLANDNANDTTYTDNTGYGHSHNYQVVGVNRWEQKLTTGSETGRVPVGDDATEPFAGGVRNISPITVASGAFTAPAAPTITVTPSTTWTDTVVWTPAPWVGSGPTSKGGARDATWNAFSASLNGSFSALWTGTPAGTTSKVNASRTPGSTTRYQATTVNQVGPSPASATVSSLQRPPAPGSCTASGPTTRSMTVTVNAAAMESAVTGYRVGTAHPDATGVGAQASNTFTIDQLSHSAGHTFTSATQNASPAGGGWSDGTDCTGTTATLAVEITGVSSTTRSVTATMATTNGSGSSLTLEGVRTDANVTSSTWDPLPDGGRRPGGYTVTARNTDGYNNVAATAGIVMKVLSTPAAPTCSVAVTDDKAPGSITISGGDQVKLGSGGPATGSPHTYGSLSAGTHTGYARRSNSDGYNTNYSAWDACPGATITDPPPTMTQGCAMSAVTASPSPGVKWVFLNLCDSINSAVLNYVYTAEFQSRSWDKDGLPSPNWVNAKYNSTQGKSSAAVDLVSRIDIRVRLTESATGTVGSWFMVTEYIP